MTQLKLDSKTRARVRKQDFFVEVKSKLRPQDVIDCLQIVSEAPQGLKVLKAFLELIREGEDMITVQLLKGRPALAQVSFASIYRTVLVLNELSLIQLMEYVSKANVRGPKPQGFDLTPKGHQLKEAIFTELTASPEVQINPT